MSQRQPDKPWGVPQPLVNLNTPEREHFPSISADGLTLYFTSFGANSNYPSPNGIADSMWVATRSSRAEAFANPEFFFDGSGTVTPDGLTHVYSGDEAFADFYGVPNLGGTPGLNYDLYVRTRDSIDEDFGPVQYSAPVCTDSSVTAYGAGLECCAWFSAADSTLYFTSIRPGTDTIGDIGFVDLWQAPLAESVPVEVMPRGLTTSIHLTGEGLLEVAILSTEEFDATQIDVDTMLFGDPLLIGDGKSPVSPRGASLEHVNKDMLADMIFTFSMGELLTNEVMGAETLQAYLTGQLLDGTVVAGRDAVVVYPPLPADFDIDGDVDGTDFLAWQENYGLLKGATKQQGDYDGDGDVDGEDFLGWQIEFGFVPGGGGGIDVAIPEPATLVMLTVFGTAVLLSVRRRGWIRG